MPIGGRSIADTIQLQHWLTLVPDTRSAQRLLIKDLTEFASRITGEADELLAAVKEEGIPHGILKTIRGVIEARATHLLRITQSA